MSKIFLAAVVALVPNVSTVTAQTRAVTFNQDIASIIFDNCTSCHRDGGGAPFALTTYAEVRQRATAIARVTASRLMPPWKPEHGFGSFAGERRLTDEEIDAIQRWVQSAAPQGSGDPRVARVEAIDWELGRPDLIVEMPEGYQLPADGPDVFRTFVVPIPLQAGQFVKGLEVRPGAAGAVHHASIKVDRTRSSRLLDQQEPGPGYDGGGGRQAVFPDGHFLAWTPGQAAQMLPDGMAWRLEPDSDLVIELHMMPTGKPEPVRVAVGLHFTDTPPLRSAAILRLGSQSIDIPAGARDYTVSDAFVLPIAVDVIGVQPHAHYLAREVRGLARLPDGSTRWLIYVKDWDFRWQDVYRFREPLSLPAGTTLSMEFSYDNSAANIRNPHRPPQRVTFGQTSASEMGNLYVQVATQRASDVAVLEREFAPKILEGDIAGYRTMLEIDPDNAQLHADLGFVYVSAGRIAEAVVQFEESIRLAPQTAAAHYALGTVLLEQRRLEPARRHFLEAVRLNPDFAAAHNNLGIVNHAEGKLPEAVASYSEALRVDGSDHRALYNRGRASAALGRYTEAITDYQASLRISPDDAATIAGLASVLASSGQVVEAIAQYRRALAIQPDERGALVDLAWLLATGDSPIRAPDEAVHLARRAAELTAHQNAVVLETLAVATRAAGDSTASIRHLEAALALARNQGQTDLVLRLETRLSAWRATP